ncbi:MAG: hypothetical protein GX116_01445 [Fibrobacter sp.]|nr:hypothetical protein [Fibrobacter sp.]
MNKWKKMFFFFLLFSISSTAQEYDLPLLLLNTNGATIPDEPKVPGTMHVIDNGKNRVSDSIRAPRYNIGIELRGQTSINFQKKGYGVELRDAEGVEVKESLLGMPAGDDWVLHGPYVDKTLIRNAIAHKLYRDTERYSPRSRHVEVFLNGDYIGVYLLLEKVKRGKDRLGLKKLKDEDLSGGYIFRHDKTNSIELEGFKSIEGHQIIFHYPNWQKIEEPAKQYLKNFYTQFEQTMRQETWKSQYERIFDVDAAVDYLLHQEMTKNSDAYICSFYMFKENDADGGKLNLGPPWDFNLAFGQVQYNNNMVVENWQVDQNMPLSSGNPYGIAPWLKTLFHDADFQNKMKSRWAELRSSVWHTVNVDALFDSLKVTLQSAQKRNFERWDVIGTAIGMDGKPNCGTGGGGWGGMGGMFNPNLCFNGYSEPTWDAEVEHLRGFLKDRIAWMDRQFDFREPSRPVLALNTKSQQLNKLYKRTQQGLHVYLSKSSKVNLYSLKGSLLWSQSLEAGEHNITLPSHLLQQVWVLRAF